MDIIQTYNPANSAITDQEISEMRNLTPDEIGELAKAYPNQPTGNAYLVYWNKNEAEKDQRYSLGTWANLWNLYKIGQKHVVPFSFRKKFEKSRVIAQNKPVAQRTVDLSTEEVLNAEGLTTMPKFVPEQAPEQDATVSPELSDLQAQLEQLKNDNAHHMTIGKVQRQIDDLQNKTSG